MFCEKGSGYDALGESRNDRDHGWPLSPFGQHGYSDTVGCQAGILRQGPAQAHIPVKEEYYQARRP